MRRSSILLTTVGRTGAWTAVAGCILAAGSAGVLMFWPLGEYVGPGDCIGSTRCGGYFLYHPFLPALLGLVAVSTAILALLVLLRPRLWWAGAASVLGGAGSIGSLALAVSLPDFRTLPYGLLPGLSFFVILGAFVEALGLLMLRPEPVRAQAGQMPTAAGN